MFMMKMVMKMYKLLLLQQRLVEPKIFMIFIQFEKDNDDDDEEKKERKKERKIFLYLYLNWWIKWNGDIKNDVFF